MNPAVRAARLALALLLPLAAAPAAAQLSVNDDRPSMVRAAVEGVISSVTPSSDPSAGPVFTLLDGLIAVDAAGADVVKPGGQPGTAADLVVGARVAVVLAEGATAPPLAARTVFVFAQPPQALLAGTVDSVEVEARTFHLLGLTVHVTDRTAWGGPRTAPALDGLEDLKPGDPVTASVTSVDGKITAFRVLVLSPAPEPMERFRGVVEEIGTSSWKIGLADGSVRQVGVNAETRIVGDPVVGDTVEVVGHADSAGGFLAQLIAKVPEAPPELERFRGVVRSIDRTEWTIATESTGASTVVVKVDAETRIVGDPRVGDTVEVLAVRDASGALLAKVIAKVDLGPPSDVVFTGVVKSILPGLWTIGDVRVMVTPMTRILGEPRVGDTVRCTGKRMPGTGMVAATLIEKLTGSAATL